MVTSRSATIDIMASASFHGFQSTFIGRCQGGQHTARCGNDDIYRYHYLIYNEGMSRSWAVKIWPTFGAVTRAEPPADQAGCRAPSSSPMSQLARH